MMEQQDMMQISRKRSRSPTRSPTPTRPVLPAAATLAAATTGEQHVDIDQLRATGLKAGGDLRTKVLNEMLQRSATSLPLEGDQALTELARIAVKECLAWNEPEEEQEDIENFVTKQGVSASRKLKGFRSKAAWWQPPTEDSRAWARHCQERLGCSGLKRIDKDQLVLLNAILVLFRNLSFVAANHRLMAYTPAVVNVLTGCLYQDVGDDANNSSSSLLVLSALQALVNLAPYLDISGQKLLADKLFYKPPLDGRVQVGSSKDEAPLIPGGVADNKVFGQAVDGTWGFGGLWLARRLDSKDDSVSGVSSDLLLQLTCQAYLVPVWSMFSALREALVRPHQPRAVVLAALDLLQELINHARAGMVGTVELDEDDDEEQEDDDYKPPRKLPSIRAVLVNMPNVLLTRLVDLLHVPRLGPDALDYLDPVQNVVTRVTVLKLRAGYDATVDTDVRDRVLELLVPLLELDSPRMAARLGGEGDDEEVDALATPAATATPKPVEYRPRMMRLLDAVIPILTTTVGRNEASMLASQLLRELNLARENRVALACFQETLVELASRDQRVSSLVWNHLYGAEEDDKEDDDTPLDEGGEEDGSGGETSSAAAKETSATS